MRPRVAIAIRSQPAFSASYDLLTGKNGATRRLTITVTLAERERQLSIARDEENMWLVQDHTQTSRSAYGGALDVDVMMSPFFNALAIRRLDLYQHAASVSLPVVYVRLPELTVETATMGYSSSGGGSTTVIESEMLQWIPHRLRWYSPHPMKHGQT